mgnify:CR=1 FL=1
MCGSLGSWGRWCTGNVCNFWEEVLVSLEDVGGGVDGGCGTSVSYLGQVFTL